MGLIKMATQAISNNLKDQVVDIFECSNMTSRILGVPATKVMRNGTVNNATDNVITNGSVFNVSINQAAILVENGKVHDFVIGTSEEFTGQYRYDSTVEPSLLGGGFSDFIPTIKKMASNFTAGGQSKNVMRIYYINCQKIPGNPVGFGNITFRDGETGVNVKAQAHGTFEFRIVNPVAFYENYVKNIATTFSLDSTEGTTFIKQLKTEMTPAFQKALGTLSQQGIRYEQLGFYSMDIAKLINEALADRWESSRGVRLCDEDGSEGIALEITFDEDSVKEILEIQKLKNYTDDRMLRAKMGVGMTEAANTAAGNTAGAMTGFMGMGMTGAMMGNQMQQFGFNGNMGNNQPYNPNAQPVVMGSLNNAGQAQGATAPVQAEQQAQQPQQPEGDSWTCACGATNVGKFCVECGTPKPVPQAVQGWTCTCGSVNQGKFCPQCGAKKPADAPLYKCDKCGWVPEDPKNPPKFCPQCGDKFDDNDIQ